MMEVMEMVQACCLTNWNHRFFKESLDLSSNILRSLPVEIGKMTSLRKFPCCYDKSGMAPFCSSQICCDPCRNV